MKWLKKVIRGVVSASVLTLVLLFAPGCASSAPQAEGVDASSGTPTTATGSDAGLPKESIDIVRVGDRVMVSFSDIPSPPPISEQRVRDDGTITLPLDVKIAAAGKRAGKLESEIRDRYVPKYYNRMTVTVKLEERYFYVGGHVRRPDRYPYQGEVTLLKAIKVAGDFTEFAKRTEVEVTRSDGTKITVDCKKAQKNPRKFDIPIYPGDNIWVNKRLW